ncbi:MAG: hypothetical protein ACLP9D_16360 [Candidatus Bathyarchaeia archaeon]
MQNNDPGQDVFFREIDKILSLAKDEAVTLRLLGATAIRSRSETAKKMSLSRKLTDLDFVAYKKDRKKIEGIFARLGYAPNSTFNMLHGDERLMFFGSDFKIDVWLEIFRMAHTFNFKDRLAVDTPTLPLSDLLMTKLQIVELNEKDVRDLICVLNDHDLSQNDENREMINVERLVDECSKNWGVYKTFTINFNKIKTLLPKYQTDAVPVESKVVLDRIDRILNSVEAAPKGLGWKMRAKVGEKKPWYETPSVR